MNPNHLRWATRQENEDDKLIHGTRTRGEAQGASKLSREDVAAIRSDERLHREIAAEYGIARQQVGKIKRREQWSWC